MKKVKKWLVFMFGGVIGIVNGLFGGGGGMILVPFLNKKLNLEQKKAQATALFIILPISLTSTIIYMFNKSIDFSNGWPVILGIIIGGAIGAILLSKLKNNLVKTLFIIFMFLGGVWMLVA